MVLKRPGKCIIKLRELHLSGGGAAGDESEGDRRQGPTGSLPKQEAALLSAVQNVSLFKKRIASEL